MLCNLLPVPETLRGDSFQQQQFPLLKLSLLQSLSMKKGSLVRAPIFSEYRIRIHFLNEPVSTAFLDFASATHNHSIWMPSLVLCKLLTRAKTSRTNVDAIAWLAHWVRTFNTDTVCQIAFARIARILVAGFIYYSIYSVSPRRPNNGARYTLIISSAWAGFLWVMVIIAALCTTLRTAL